jgi:hypothetical protein
MRHKRSQGERVGNIAFAYRLSADGKHLEPNPSEQTALAEIRNLRGPGAPPSRYCGDPEQPRASHAPRYRMAAGIGGQGGETEHPAAARENRLSPG